MTCDRALECDSTVDVESCTQDCLRDAEAIGPNLSSDFLHGVDACLQALSCPELAVATVSMRCQREAAADIAPSATAQALCEAVVASIQECVGVSVDTAGCLTTVKIFRDPVLDAARSCQQQSCDLRWGCLEEHLGIDPREGGR